jgi:carboxyl-terminal processing protease
MMGNKKLQVWLPLIFSIVMIIGMVLGYQLGSKDGSRKGFFSSNNRSVLQEAVDLIRRRYVDAVQLDSLQGRAIQEMMTGLDPHSVYFPPVELKAANEDLAGNFEGIGVEFNIFNDTVHVINVMPKGPSEKAGLAVADKIIAVGNISLTTRNLSIDSIKTYIRGEKNSKADLKIIRAGKPMTITVTRGTIPVTSVDASYMINAGTGYIKLNKFTDNCYEEFMEAMEALKKTGLKSLVLDLRGNGGGFMGEAVQIADEFLDGDKLVVYTEGTNSKKREYRCRRNGIFEKGKLVLLIDELSASASEALAGAMQDWCRATIVGRRTFGKGLVQEQYSLSDGSAIRLTVARYYTPLGRSIQRSYEKGKKIYMDELWERFNSGELLSMDSIKTRQNGKKFTTVCGDTLYGGDGIIPNIFVPIDTSLALQKVARLMNDESMARLLYNYYLENKEQISQYTSLVEFVQQFNVDPLVNARFQSLPDSIRNRISANEKGLFALRVKAFLARYRWRSTGFYQVLNNEDPMVKKAVSITGG